MTMSNGKVFSLGDLHGGHKALLQVIERSGIDKENDTLIFLGDVADGWPEVPECVEELLTFKRLIPIRGNHDEWVRQWMDKGLSPELRAIWLPQGGQATFDAYIQGYGDKMLRDQHHDKFFNKQVPYYIDDKNRIFTHGGFDLNILFEDNTDGDFAWNRNLWREACDWLHARPDSHKNIKLSNFDEIFIGHTTTERWSDTPIRCCNVWNLDQGAGWGGKLSLMDVNSKHFFQSDKVKTLYPYIKGR